MKRLGYTIFGFATIFLIYCLCVFSVEKLGVHFPAPILGIFLLFFLMKMHILPSKFVKDGCNIVLKFMILFFIPLFVGIVKYYKLIYQNLLPIMFTIFFTTFLTIISVGLFYEWTLKYVRLYRIKAVKK